MEQKVSCLDLKRKGFSDARLAQLLGINEKEVRKIRHKLNVRPCL